MGQETVMQNQRQSYRKTHVDPVLLQKLFEKYLGHFPLTEPRQCEGLGSHWWQHLDEIIAKRIAVLYGSHIYLGIDKAPRFYWDAGIRTTPDGRSIKQWDYHHLIFGMGGGQGDEHALPQELQQLHCATTIAALMFGRQNDPALKPILEALVQEDRHAKRQRHSAAAFVWSLYYDGATEAETDEVFSEWFDVIYLLNETKLAGEKPLRPIGRPDLNEYIRLWVLAEYEYNAANEEQLEEARRSPSGARAAHVLGVDGRAEVNTILKLEDRQHTFGCAGLFDIHTYVEAMHAAAKPEVQVRSRVFRLLNALRHEQTLFWAACDEIDPMNNKNSPARFVQLWKDPQHPQKLIRINCSAADRDAVLKQYFVDKSHKLVHEICVIESDAPLVHKAARHILKTTIAINDRDTVEFKVDLLLIRKSNKQGVIFGSKVKPEPLIARLRLNEHCRGKNSHKPLPVEVRAKIGNIAEEPHWCFNYDPEFQNWQFINGGLTDPHTPGSLLATDVQIDGLVESLRANHDTVHLQHRQLDFRKRPVQNGSHPAKDKKSTA